MSKKCISSVVAIALLLVVSVITVISFQNWYQSYSSSMFTDLEIQVNSNEELNIQTIIGNTLYVVSGSLENVTLNKLQIDGVDCIIDKNLSNGMNEFDVSGCLSSVKDSIPQIMIMTGDKIIKENIYIENLNIFPIPMELSLCNSSLVSGLYILNSSIFLDNAGCFYFTESNIIFDCQNNMIQGDFDDIGDAFTGSYGLVNITIKNCIIEGFRMGVYSNSFDNLLIYNSTLNNNLIDGVYFGSWSNNIQLLDSTFINNTRFGISFGSNSKNIMIRNSHINSNPVGVYFFNNFPTNSYNITLLNNDLLDNDLYSVYLNDSSDILFYGNYLDNIFDDDWITRSSFFNNSIVGNYWTGLGICNNIYQTTLNSCTYDICTYPDNYTIDIGNAFDFLPMNSSSGSGCIIEI